MFALRQAEIEDELAEALEASLLEKERELRAAFEEERSEQLSKHKAHVALLQQAGEDEKLDALNKSVRVSVHITVTHYMSCSTETLLDEMCFILSAVKGFDQMPTYHSDQRAMYNYARILR